MLQQALARCGRNLYTELRQLRIKRAVRGIDAHQADAAMCAWLRQESAVGRLTVRQLAVDGKTIKGARDKAGKAPHLLAACDLTDGTVPGQLDVDARHNEITYLADLLALLAAGPGQDEDDPGQATDRGGGG